MFNVWHLVDFLGRWWLVVTLFWFAEFVYGLLDAGEVVNFGVELFMDLRLCFGLLFGLDLIVEFVVFVFEMCWGMLVLINLIYDSFGYEFAVCLL